MYDEKVRFCVCIALGAKSDLSMELNRAFGFIFTISVQAIENLHVGDRARK